MARLRTQQTLQELKCKKRATSGLAFERICSSYSAPEPNLRRPVPAGLAAPGRVSVPPQASHCASFHLFRLFTYVNEKLFSKPTYAAFINLLNNYQRATGRGEHFNAQQLAEQDTFLREVMKTAVMKELYGFLHHQRE